MGLSVDAVWWEGLGGMCRDEASQRENNLGGYDVSVPRSRIGCCVGVTMLAVCRGKAEAMSKVNVCEMRSRCRVNRMLCARGRLKGYRERWNERLAVAI